MHHIRRCPKHTLTAAHCSTAHDFAGVVACQGASWAGCSTPSPCPAPPCCMPRNAAPRRATPRRTAPHRVTEHCNPPKSHERHCCCCCDVCMLRKAPGLLTSCQEPSSARVCRILVVKVWATFEMVIYRKLQAHQIEDRRWRARKLLLLLHGRYPVAGRGRAKARGRAPRITQLAFSLAP